MAEEIALDIKINAAAGANTVKELKKELKGLKDELNNVEAGSAEFNKLTKAINNTEGKLGDLNDQFNTLTGSGVERSTKSLNLFKEGFATFDFDKIKLGFKGLAASMSAIPIFLLIEGLKLLWENLGTVTRFLKETSTGFDEVAESAAKANQELIDYLELNKKIEEQDQKSFDHEIKLAELRGESIEKITQKKIAQYKQDVENAKANEIITQKYIDNNKKILKALEDIGMVDSEQYKKVREQQDDLVKKSVEYANQRIDGSRKIQVASLEQIKNEKDAREKADEKHKADLEKLTEKHKEELAKRKEAYDKFAKDLEDFEAKVRETELQALRIKYNAEQKALDDKAKYEADVNAVKEQIDLQNYQKKRDLLAQEDADIQASLEARKEGYAQFEKEKFELTKQSLQAAQAISDLVFAHQLRQANGNAAKEREIKKRQFKLNKAFGIAGATIDGVQAVQKALNNPYPLNIVLAVLSGALAAANVIKIASTKFDDGGGGGGADVGGLGGGIGGAAPAIPQPNNTVTQIQEDGTNKAKEQPVVKAVVVETDMTEKQKKVKSIEETATI